jgi:hypothetical protein
MKTTNGPKNACKESYLFAETDMKIGRCSSGRLSGRSISSIRSRLGSRSRSSTRSRLGGRSRLGRLSGRSRSSIRSRLGGRSRLGSQTRCDRRGGTHRESWKTGGGTHRESRAIIVNIHTFYRFFNLFSNNQSQTLLWLFHLKLSNLRILRKNYHTQLTQSFKIITCFRLKKHGYSVEILTSADGEF